MREFGGGILVSLVLCGAVHAQGGAPLRLERTIALPGVEGRIDHLAFDEENQRLFVAALGNNTVEVVDMKSGAVVHTIGGLAEPQGVVYEPGKKRIWIANGDDGTVRIFDGQTFGQVGSISLGADADNVRRDLATQRIYVGYGDGGLAAFDAEGKKVADVKLDAHPESFQLERNGSRIFVNLPGSGKIAVIDRTKSSVTATWQTDDATANFPMALDEADGRLFVVCRRPAVLLVLDVNTGAVIAKLPTVGDSDDVFYDPKRKRIYASGGEGAIVIYQQRDSDHYVQIGRMDTVAGARTSLFVPELDLLFLAVRRQGENAAAIRVYEITP